MKDAVLIVDDDRTLLKSYQSLLQTHYAVTTASGGKEALDIMAAHPPFKVIVSDLQMPHMDGIHFLHQCKHLQPHSVRILLTGHADVENAIKSVNEGSIFRFLTKPCAIEQLKSAIAAALEQHDLLLARDELHYLRSLQQTMEGVLVGFSNALEARDPYTAGHQRRVAELCVAMAQKLGKSKESTNTLRMAALVHDIGKIYVPTDFLNRPGKLREPEFEIVKTHAQVGYEILSPINFSTPICTIVQQHHEKLDGTGYPNGLTAKEILPEAKILAVADVVEAISAHRPYRPSLGIETALEEVQRHKGTKYSAEAVDAVTELFMKDGFAFSG